MTTSAYWYAIDEVGIISGPFSWDTPIITDMFGDRARLRVVAQSTLSMKDYADYFISTVFLSLNQNLSREEPSILFETLIEGPDNESGVVTRCDSLRQAIEGHLEHVSKLILSGWKISKHESRFIPASTWSPNEVKKEEETSSSSNLLSSSLRRLAGI